jgi:hypothetical protein
MILGVDKINDRGNLCETTKLYKLKEVTLSMRSKLLFRLLKELVTWLKFCE